MQWLVGNAHPTGKVLVLVAVHGAVEQPPAVHVYVYSYSCLVVLNSVCSPALVATGCVLVFDVPMVCMYAVYGVINIIVLEYVLQYVLEYHNYIEHKHTSAGEQT
jgi:hypothetical protein